MCLLSLCVCVCLDINNVVHVPATFIATSHGGRSGRVACSAVAIGTPAHSGLDPQPPRQRHLECSTQVYLRFLRPLLPMTFCLLKCKIYRSTAAAAAAASQPRSSVYAHSAHSPKCPTVSMSRCPTVPTVHKNNAPGCHYRSRSCKWLCLLWAFASGLLPP